MQWALGSTSGKSKKTSKSDEQQGRSSDGSSHALGAGQQQKNNEGSLHWAGEQPVRAGTACSSDGSAAALCQLGHGEHATQKH